MISWLDKTLNNILNIPEQQLIKKSQEGQGDAFGKLYMKYLDSIYRYVFFRVNQNQPVAEDITEVVFFKAWRGIQTFSLTQGNFRAWLYRIAHNAVVDHYKVQKPSTRIDEVAEHADKKNIQDAIESEERKEALMHAINQLTDSQKTIITLKFIEGLSNKEIAQIVSKKEDAIRAIQHRGLESLREILKQYE